MSTSDVLEMIQFKWFIVGSHVFSKLFLRVPFGQTYYTLKFNLQGGWGFFSSFLFSLEKNSTLKDVSFPRDSLTLLYNSPYFLKIKHSSNSNKKNLEVFDRWYMFYQTSNSQSLKSSFTTCKLQLPYNKQSHFYDWQRQKGGMGTTVFSSPAQMLPVNFQFNHTNILTGSQVRTSFAIPDPICQSTESDTDAFWSHCFLQTWDLYEQASSSENTHEITSFHTSVVAGYCSKHRGDSFNVL